MKKQHAGLFAILMVSGSLFFSCGNPSQKGNSPTFDSIKVDKSAHLFGDTANPGCNIHINLAYVSKMDKQTVQDSLNAFLLSVALGDTCRNDAPQVAVNKYVDKYISDYLKNNEPLYNKDKAEHSDDEDTVGEWYDFYKSIESRPLSINNRMLVYQVDYSEFTGGAHGIYMSTFLNIDLADLHPIRLSDLFTEDYSAALTDLLWTQLLIDNKLKSRKEAEDMGYASTGDLAPTENFFLGEKGITFYYNIYEITPYVLGPVQITLSYDAVKSLLREEAVTNYDL
ncbi:MAG: DUF3298 and DUF4163 domain-containing protein [Mediterranea sp.]|nr:DUF3298 and DUF4163 domain-containing protein [Mediterranea sp.]